MYVCMYCLVLGVYLSQMHWQAGIRYTRRGNFKSQISPCSLAFPSVSLGEGVARFR